MAAVGVLRRVIQVLVGLVVIVIVAGILLYVFDLNDPGTFPNSVIDLAAKLVKPFRGVTELKDNRVEIAITFGVGAVVWLVGAAIVDRLLALAQRRARRR